MNNFYVYLYIDPSRNDEVFYVGKGTSYRSHKHLKRKDKHPMAQKVQKMLRDGVEPIITKLECSSESIAFELERGLINTIGRKDLNEGTLLNLTNGGEGVSGRITTEETRQKLKLVSIGNRNGLGYKHTPDACKKISDGLRGKPKSVEHIAKAASAKKGMKFSPEHRAKLSAAKMGNKNRLGRVS